MRIGIVPNCNPSSGGLYQYSLTMLEAIRTLQQRELLNDEVITLDYPQAPHKSKIDILAGFLGDGRLKRIAANIYHAIFLNPDFLNPDKVTPNPALARYFQEYGIDWMLYPSPTTTSFEAGIPYIAAVHDLQHRLHPEYPEVSAGGLWLWRECMFRNSIRNAMMVLVDSEVGKEDVMQFYGQYITEERIKVLPFLPASYLSVELSQEEAEDIRKKYNLPERYLFYPAQFWLHKNHLRIIKALGILKERNLDVDIVFVGSCEGKLKQAVFNEVMSCAKHLGILKSVHYLGYVSDEHMSVLYSNATALIMPTFFGPTNIPPLEAWKFGCPVITSDIRGIREQMGDAAILVNPESTESIAEGIYDLLVDMGRCVSLIEKGYARLAEYGPADYQQRLLEIIKQANSLRGQG